ncbi:MAG TPA: hypothetical protein HA252_07105 [Candidatus Diapherotrites archaeon]|uniref:Uncharacterized protein n=1 Tax=Candidatus Iainarchaeum sp. TaxID=3101447 RepID=A0A7J4JIG9_9ARCH|nr:hypothetical protein [Candidatus Diapherotrites archaeon]HIH17144.1 hypothetical protein [Candidatus Diapherotrites archaeon]
MHSLNPVRVGKQQGALSLEAMAALAALLAVLSLMVGTWQDISFQAMDAGHALHSFLEAESCATLADSLYSNAGGELSTALPCGFSDHAASASSGQAIHSASILSAHAEFDGQKLRVNVLEHYK